MVFHTARKLIDYPVLQIDNITIERIQKFNFLGLYIKNNLTWDTHQNHISLKTSKIIGTMNRLKYIYPQHILHMLYNTLILPHLNYCLIVWGFNSSRILLLQKRAMRTITNSWYRAHTSPIFRSLNILKINDLYWLMVLKFYYKLENKLLPSYFDEFIPKKSAGSTVYSIRNPQNQMPKIKHEYAKKLFRCELIKITNIINNSDFLRDIFDRLYTHSLHGYSHHIKNKLINNYSTDCVLENCYICGNYHNLIPDANE